MSKMLLNFGGIFLVCVFYLADLSSSQRYIGGAFNEDYPGMCFYNDTKTPIKIGSTFRPTTECVEIKCKQEYVLHLQYCPFYMVGAGCNVTFDKAAEFPDCCAKITCPMKK